jgi:hypothetical protein
MVKSAPRFVGGALALAVLIVMKAPSAAAPPTPKLDPEQLEWGCVPECRAWSDKEQALFCLDGGESLACNDCQGAFLKVSDKKVDWQLLQACGQMEPLRDMARLDAVNRRLVSGGYAQVEALWGSGDVKVVDRALQGDIGDGVRVERRGDELLIAKGDTVLDRTRWRFDPDQDPEHEITRVIVYALGPERLFVVFDYHNPDFVIHDRRHVLLTRAAAKPTPASTRPARDLECPAAAKCSPAYGKVHGYLEAVCAGSLGPADLAALEAMAAYGGIGTPELVLLFNAHGALYGYRFESEAWLNDLFYGTGREAWLPAPCVERFRSYRRASEVPAADTKARDALKAIWRHHK